MSTRPSVPETLLGAFRALRQDLVHADGPRISTMRNHRFAIVQYAPRHELAARAEAQRLSADLLAHGWAVLSIDLHKLLLDRLRAQGEDWLTRVQQMEARMAAIDPARGLGYVQSKIAACIEGPEGLAADCSRIICAYADAHPEHIDRTLALVGGAGGLYPFYRSSALLRHLDGRTRNVPVVLLYPGRVHDPGEGPAQAGAGRGTHASALSPVGGGLQSPTGTPTGLSFMGLLSPDNDYRPRIYQGGR